MICQVTDKTIIKTYFNVSEIESMLIPKNDKSEEYRIQNDVLNYIIHFFGDDEISEETFTEKFDKTINDIKLDMNI